MKVSREQVGENRRRILDEAGRLFRARGFEAVTVAEVMKAAGLTHGAFYGHFQSKDDLIAQTLGHVLGQAQVGDELQPFVDFYLSPHHCDDLAGGCPTAGLGADAIRQSPQARQAMTEGLRRHLQHMTRMESAADEATRRRQAIGTWSAMVGAVILARLSDDPALSEEVLAQTRAWIDETSAASAS
ncbi:TetR/AcrR family transcriptional regulator [Lysobacter capsici]|uniref:TetR/AcrR family transcriptional regulator n=1 Tax=Lysobacter capsici TaxID=435897 RepID=UPI001C008E9F|nr:TetR/AcrR family transcriptional regulator [Lysobacter capsici]QWF14837.1 TetR/AcrR family transcriptional regulator [Lysobacter capsici]